MTPDDREIVRTFRRQAADVRSALAALGAEAKGMRVVDGYIEIDQWLERYRRLCIPVRRTFLTHDKASFRTSAGILRRHADPDLRARAEVAAQTYEAILQELDRETVLGGRRVKGTAMLTAWLDAAVFAESTDRRKSYEEMQATLGRAVEGIAAEFTEELARAVLALDDVAASALDEPVILPPPEPTRPPPREPRRWAFRWPRSNKS